MPAMRALCIGFQHALGSFNTSPIEEPRGTTSCARIGIADRIDNAAYAGCNNGIRARRRLPVMAARLQADIERGPLGIRCCIAQGLGLRMGTPAWLGPAARNNDPVFDDEGAD